MRTSTPKPPAPRWLLLDADGASLGRLAARIAMILRGKDWEGFSPHHVCGDHVMILNMEKLHVPEKKFHRKIYYKHTGHTGHLRSFTLKEAWEKRPTWVMEHAVKSMLPSNRLRPEMLKRLHVFRGADHPYAAQKPQRISMNSSKLLSQDS